MINDTSQSLNIRKPISPKADSIISVARVGLKKITNRAQESPQIAEIGSSASV